MDSRNDRFSQELEACLSVSTPIESPQSHKTTTLRLCMRTQSGIRARCRLGVGDAASFAA